MTSRKGMQGRLPGINDASLHSQHLPRNDSTSGLVSKKIIRKHQGELA